MLSGLRRILPVLALMFFAFGCASAPVPTPTPSAKPAAPAAAPTAVPKTSAPTVVATPTAAAQAAPKTLTKLKIVYPALAGNQVPTWIAKDERVFEKYGLDVDLSYVASSTTAMQSMLGGEISVISGVSGGQVIAAALGGSDAVIIGSLSNTVVMYLMAAPSIQRPEDLKGKAVGITRFGSITDFAARYALNKMGLDPEKDVTIVQVGGVPEILGAMQSGAIAAGSLSSPTDLKAREAGFKEMMDIGAAGLPYPNTQVASTRRYVAANGPTVLNVMRALVEATYLFKTNRSMSLSVIGKYTKTDDRKMLESTYDAYVGKVEKIPYATKEAIQAGIDEVAQTNPKAKGSDPNSFVDMQFVKQLEDSGFIKQLYKE